MLGTVNELILNRAHQLAIPLVFSLVQIIMGISMLLIFACIVRIDAKVVLFFWLGLFSLSTGLWAFGENNFSVLLFPNNALLYLLSFIGFFTFIVPLLRFVGTIIYFENPKPIQVMEIFCILTASTALLLQLTGKLAFSKSMYFFHMELPVVLLLITFLTAREYVRYKTRDAGRFILPIAILALSSLLELLNYQAPFTYLFSSIFQMGIVIFLLTMGISAGMFLKDSLELKRKKQELAYEKNLLHMQMEEQQKTGLLLEQNQQELSRQRHDLRHHLTVIWELSEEKEKLQEYLSTIINKLPKARERYCENIIVNAVISHYATVCEQKEIAFTARLTVPHTKNKTRDNDLCVIFSNLLENAVEACERMADGKKFIELRSTVGAGLLTITMDNSFYGEMKKQGERFLSSVYLKL